MSEREHYLSRMLKRRNNRRVQFGLNITLALSGVPACRASPPLSFCPSVSSSPPPPRPGTEQYNSSAFQWEFSCTVSGFFWLNMARRFRSALLPAQNNNSAPSPATGAQDMARHYGNIHPRRPINMDAAALSVNARPSLEDIRMAHGRANGSTETDESDSDDYDE